MICSACVTPQPLKDLLNRHGLLGTCSYCKNTGTAVERKFLFDYIYQRVRENVAAEDDLSDFEHASIYEMGSDDIAVSGFDIVLMEWFNLGDEVYFDDLCDGVPHDFKVNVRGKETHFYSDDGLLERNFYEDSWAEFIDDIRHAHRFFNPKARGFLDSVFKLLVSENDALKPDVIRTLDHGVQLYRARSADSYKKAKEIADEPASQLGPTPKDKASSQRMTSNGILPCTVPSSAILA